MSDGDPEALGTALVYEGLVPLAWRTAPDPERGVREAELDNEQTLKSILGLDEVHPESTEEESLAAPELRRVEFKLNLILDLIGELLAAQLDLPPATAVSLGGRRLNWECADPPAPGDPLRIEIYLDSRYPRPLVLFGTPRLETGGAHPRVAAEIVPPGPGVQDLLEKFIFRQHRRHVASSRRPPL